MAKRREKRGFKPESKAGPEVKFWDDAEQFLEIDKTDQGDFLCQPPQGVEDFNRVGDKLYVVRMDFRANAIIHPDTIGSTQIRLMVVLDINETLSSIPLLDSDGATGVLATMRYEKKDRQGQFRTLIDETFTLTQNYQQAIHKSWSLNQKQIVKFNASSTTVNSGQYKVFVIGTEAAASDTKPQLNYYARFRFYDN